MERTRGGWSSVAQLSFVQHLLEQEGEAGRREATAPGGMAGSQARGSPSTSGSACGRPVAWPPLFGWCD